MGAQHVRGLGGKNPQRVLTTACFDHLGYFVSHSRNARCVPACRAAGVRLIIVNPYADFPDFQLS